MQRHLQHQLHPFLKKEHLKRVINAISIEDATEIDYFITNVEPSKVTPEWIVNSYSLQKLDRGFLSRSTHDG